LNGDPATGLFRLSVDGVQIASGTAGPVTASENLIFVGDGTSIANAAGEYTSYSYQLKSSRKSAVEPKHLRKVVNNSSR